MTPNGAALLAQIEQIETFLKEHMAPDDFAVATALLRAFSDAWAEEVKNLADLQFGRGYREGQEAGRRELLVQSSVTTH